MAELADAVDLKSTGREVLWVRVPPALQAFRKRLFGTIASFLLPDQIESGYNIVRQMAHTAGSMPRQDAQNDCVSSF